MCLIDAKFPVHKGYFNDFWHMFRIKYGSFANASQTYVPVVSFLKRLGNVFSTGFKELQKMAEYVMC